MPMDKEERKEYNRLRYIANKEKLLAQMKTYRETNKEKILKEHREYRIANKEYYKEYKKAYYQTPEGKKSRIMACWRSHGVNNVNDEMYDKYINTHCCDVCKNEFKNSMDKHLDHDHETGDFRQVLCRSCNSRDSWKNKIKEE